MDNRRIQWHPAFCSAMRLELRKYKEDLDFCNEYNLSAKPLQIDLLVIKKTPDAVIDNEIGRIFRTMGYNLTNPWPGIYYVNKEGFFPLQVIASGEMRQEAHVWLSSLRSDLSNQAAEQLFLFAHELNRKDDVDAAQSILEVVVRANRPAFEAVKEEDTIMAKYTWFQELFAPEIEAAERKAVMEAKKEVAEEVTKEVTKEVTREVTRAKDIQSARTAFAANLDFELARKLAPTLTIEELHQIQREAAGKA